MNGQDQGIANPFANDLLCVPPPPINPYGEAIASIESAGSGGYSALGPVTHAGDQAIGRYQVMGSNVGDWTEKYLGRRLTKEEFLNDPRAQDAVFNGKFGELVDKYGPQGAARAWFTGSPTGGGSDVFGTTGDRYVAKFNAALAGGQPNLIDRNLPGFHGPFASSPIAHLLGTGAFEGNRYQMWPEQLARLALGTPYAAMSGQLGMPGTREFTENALPGATAMTAFAAGGALPFAEENALGIFGGRASMGADMPAMNAAQALERIGMKPMDIWKSTGWSRSGDGQLRYEIPDEGASLGPMPPSGTTMKLGDFLDHPKLYEAYPELKNVDVQVDRNMTGRGQLKGNTITINPSNTDDPLSTILHEAQHRIQFWEGFSRGASPESVRAYIAEGLSKELEKADSAKDEPRVNDLLDVSERFLKSELPPYEFYRSIAGEVEARNVQHRLFLLREAARQGVNPLRALREIPPWKSEDVPRNMQIPLFEMGMPIAVPGSDGRRRTLEPVEGNPFEGAGVGG